MTIGEDVRTDNGPAAAVTGRFVMDEEGDWYLLFDDEKFLHHGIFG